MRPPEGIRRRHLRAVGNNLMAASPVSPGELQPLWYLLEGQHGLEHRVLEVTAVTEVTF